MKHVILLSALLFSGTKILAQFSSDNLEINATKATISNGGVFFSDPSFVTGGFEYPTNSGNHLIHSSAFWFGGTDVNSNLYLSAQMYDYGVDLFRGSLTGDGTATAPVPPFAGEIYKVTRAEIDNHIANYQNVGYVVPNSFIDWPAHGDVTQNLDYYLAPFVDVNGDQTYNPELGDYPSIRGDEAIFLIMNDKAALHTGSNGIALGIECHFMFYQFDSSDVLGNTTFLHLKVMNRSTNTFFDFKTGLFVDPDLGGFDDDFAGCDTTKQLMYCYNGDNLDDIYGNNPPALGVVNLNGSMSSFGTFASMGGPMGDPATAMGYWQYMSGNWLNAASFTQGGNGFGGTTPTNFLYNGNPNDVSAWSELTAGNTPGDRKMYMTTNPVVLLPAQEICFDYAFIVADNGTNLENVDNLIAAADSVSQFFIQQTFGCYKPNESLGVNGNGEKDETISIYPVPASDNFQINISGEFNLSVFTMDGKLVFEKQSAIGNQPIYANLESGSYIVQVFQNDKNYTLKLVVN